MCLISFFFSSRRRHTRSYGDWSSDVCSSDLQWATGGLRPDLTVLLDLPPLEGLGRRAPSADRLEAEPADFHQRVRDGFLAQARQETDRYLVLDAARPPDELSREIQDRIRDMLPDPVPAVAEDNTGSIPAILE